MLIPLDFANLSYVAQHMRADDRREIFATQWQDSESLLVGPLYHGSHVAKIALADDQTPIAALGAVEMWPGVWSVWMFATDRWREVANKVSKYLRQQFIPLLLEQQAHRAECMAIADRPVVHRWLQYLGARPEAFLRHYGKNREDFILFSWERENMCKGPFKTPKPPKLPEMPTRSNDEILAAMEEERRRARLAKGRSSTLLSADEKTLGAAPSYTKKLLGE